jgi:uncharacterized membrane protein (UPF0127 family)
MKKRSKILLLSCAVVVIILLALVAWRYTAILRLGLPHRQVSIEGRAVTVLVADTRAEREEGLQNILWMPSHMGMLFVFPRENKYCFWNKNTYLNLKLLFMSKGKVVDTALLPSLWHGKTIVCPKEDIDAVIEINAR